MKRIQLTDCGEYAPKLYDSFVIKDYKNPEGEIFVMVQELLYGISLDDLIYQNKDIHYLFTIVKNLLNIMNCLHGNGIVHNDVKANNFIWNGKKLKIIDFGESSYEGIECQLYNPDINDVTLDIKYTLVLIVQIFSNVNFGYFYALNLYKNDKLSTIFQRCTGSREDFEYIENKIINLLIIGFSGGNIDEMFRSTI